MLTAAPQILDRRQILLWLALAAGVLVSAVAAWAVWTLTPVNVVALFFVIIFIVLLALAPNKRRFILGAAIFVIPLNIDQNFIL